MIAYEDLCTALDRYNRRLRGEVVPEAEPMYEEAAEVLEMPDMPSGSQPPPHPAFGVSYGSNVPAVTEETALPEGSYGEPGYAQDPYSSQTPGSGPVPPQTTPYPGGQDPYRQ